VADLNVRRAINVILTEGLGDFGLGLDQLHALQNAALSAMQKIQSGRRNPRTDPQPGDLFCTYPWGASASRYVESISTDPSGEAVVKYCDPFKAVKRVKQTRLRYWKNWAGSDNVDVFQIPSHSDGFCRIAHTPFHLYNDHAEPTCRQRQILVNQGCEWIGRVRFCAWCRETCDEPELLQGEVPQVVLDYLGGEGRGDEEQEREDEDELLDGLLSPSLAIRSWDLHSRLEQLIQDHEGDPRAVLYDWSDEIEEFVGHAREVGYLSRGNSDARLEVEHGQCFLNGLSAEQRRRLSQSPILCELVDLH